MRVLTEIKNREVQDIIIACIMDNHSGFLEAVRFVFTNTRVQLCIVHMVRNSTKYISYKELKKVCADLKTVYSANTEAATRDAFENFGKKWDDKYLMIYKSCKLGRGVKPVFAHLRGQSSLMRFADLNKVARYINNRHMKCEVHRHCFNFLSCKSS